MRRRLVVIGNIGIALLLLGLGMPQALTAFHRLPADAALAGIANGRPGDDGALRRGLISLDAAERWWPDARTMSEIGWSHIYLSRIAKRPDGARAELRLAAEGLEEALARSPANARDWAGLALARDGLADADGAAQAIEMSLLTYPHRPEWALWRCEIGFLVYGHLSDFGRHLFSDQLRYAWVRYPGPLLGAARLANFSPPGGIALLEDALAEDPQLARQLDAALAPGR